MSIKPRHIAILGSTGSIRTQALDVVREQQGRFVVEVLSSNNKVDLLIEQAREVQPNAVVIGDTRHDRVAATRWRICRSRSSRVPMRPEQVVQMDGIDMVRPRSSAAGPKPTLSAIRARQAHRPANKERWWWQASSSRLWRRGGEHLSRRLRNIRRSFNAWPVSGTTRSRRSSSPLPGDRS